MKKSIFLLAFLLSMLWHVSAVAEECSWSGGFCFGINWKNATLADVQAINVRAKDKSGRMPLHWAAWNNENPDIINALIQSGADINAKSKNGGTPLHWAAENNENPDIIAALIQAGADINAKINNGGTPLHRAALRNENLDIITALIQAGANINAKSKSGNTPLHRAALRNENLDIITALIQAGSDIHAKNKDGYTAEDIDRGGIKIALKVILKDLKDLGGINWQTAVVADVAKADLSARLPITGETVLHSAAQYSTPEVVAALIATRVGSRDKNGATALHAAVKSGNVGVFAILIDKININTQDKNGNTPLHYAVIANQQQAVLLLLENGVDAAISNANGATALHAAVKSGNVDALAVLIDKININAQDKNGNTPLHYAVFANQQQAVLLLLENGADATISNANGKTPLALADENLLDTDFKNSEAYWVLNDASYAGAN